MWLSWGYVRLRLFLLWLRLTRPRSYARLIRLWRYQLLEAICSIAPPEFALMKRSTASIIEEWKTD